MNTSERYIITARNTKGCVIEHFDQYPISVILGNEDYYDRITQTYIDAFDTNVDSEMDVADAVYKFEKNSHYTSFEIIDLAKEFLATLDEKYVKDLDDLINSGHLFITDPRDISNGDKLDTENITNYQKPIYSGLGKFIVLPMHNNITDAETLVHEFMHYELEKNMDEEHEQPIMRIFHEMNSIFHEYLFYDYLNRKGLFDNDCRKQLLKRLYHTRLDAENVNLDAKIIKLTDEKLPVTNLEYDLKESDKIFRKLRSSCLYFKGGAFGAILYDRYKAGIINYKNIENFIASAPRSGSDDMVLNYLFNNEELEFTKEEIFNSVNHLFDEFELNSLNNKKVR